jgi:hypothetical protein
VSTKQSLASWAPPAIRIRISRSSRSTTASERVCEKPGRSTACLRARLSKWLYWNELATGPRPSGSGVLGFLHSPFFIPSVRAVAQQLWQSFFVQREEVVNVDFNQLIGKPTPPRSVRDLAEASQLAGFTARLPKPGTLTGTPSLSIMAPMSFVTTRRSADLDLALRKAGITSFDIPKQWDGAQLAYHQGTVVLATWPQEVTLMQCLPAAITVPPGFDLPAFAALILRAAGMPPKAAERYARRMAAAPAQRYRNVGSGYERQGHRRARNRALERGRPSLHTQWSHHSRVRRHNPQRGSSKLCAPWRTKTSRKRIDNLWTSATRFATCFARPLSRWLPS